MGLGYNDWIINHRTLLLNFGQQHVSSCFPLVNFQPLSSNACQRNGCYSETVSRDEPFAAVFDPSNDLIYLKVPGMGDLQTDLIITRSSSQEKQFFSRTLLRPYESSSLQGSSRVTNIFHTRVLTFILVSKLAVLP